MEYTYDDIVTAKDILTGRVRKEDIIGKKGWFLDYIPNDMSLNTIMRITGNPEELKQINLGMSYVFENKNNVYNYFLPEKEEPVCNPPDYLTDKSIFFIDFQAFCSLQTIWEMYRDLCPEIKGYTVDDQGYFIAFDNTAREFFVEEFDSREEAVAWLRGEEAEKPEYIPFDLSLEEDRNALRDRWVKSANPDVFHEFKVTQFIRMNDDHQTIYAKAGSNRYSGNDLFYDYVFADGSPVGKPANGQ